MSQFVSEVMSTRPVTITAESPIADAAKAMREADIGDVIVLNKKGVCGIVTDRDVVVRAAADGMDLSVTPVSEICSKDITTVAPDTPIETAVDLMRQKAIRRLPVVENDQPVGVVSLGDLAQNRDPSSALADISSAPPNS